MICIRCGSQNIVKNGFKKLENKSVQKYRCNDCSKYFTGQEKFHHLSSDQIKELIKLKNKKVSQRKTALKFCVHLRTVQYHLEKNENKKEDF